MFGKAKCKLCNNNVRFVLRHLKEKHPETLKDIDVIKLNMSRIMKKYFVWQWQIIIKQGYSIDHSQFSGPQDLAVDASAIVMI